MTFLVGLPPTAQGELCRVCAPDDAARPPAAGQHKAPGAPRGRAGGGGYFKPPSAATLSSPSRGCSEAPGPPQRPESHFLRGSVRLFARGGPRAGTPLRYQFGVARGGGRRHVHAAPTPRSTPGCVWGAPPVVPSVGARPATCRPPRPGAARGD